MWNKSSIGFRLNCMIVLLLLATCVAVIIINATLSRRALENEIITRTLPAMASEVVAEVDRQLVAPATTLEAMAQHPLLQEWIKNGEDPALVPLIFQSSKNVAAMHNAGGVNVVIRDSLNYYELSGGKERVKTILPDIDGWFFDFEKSGDPLWVNIHGPNDPHYANLAFVNRRIDDNGRFLGIVSVGMQVKEFNERLASMRIGEQGATFLVRKNGEIMLHPDVTLNGKQLTELPELAAAGNAALNAESMTFTTVNAKGEKILVATREIPILNAVVFSEASSSELLQDINKAWMYSAVAGFGILVIGFILSTMFVRTITRPLNKIIEYAGDVAAEKSVTPPSEGVGGEIGVLLTSVNTMVNSIASRVAEIEEKNAEAGRQTALANEALAMSREKEHQVGDLIATMLRVSKEAEGIAEEVASASISCAQELEGVSKMVLENDQRLGTVAESMNTMQASVEAMSSSAAVATQSTVSAKTSAGTGEAILDKAISAIDAVNTEVDRLQQRLESLGDKAASIGQILNVISDIADQTNLLALNAAIEAARAGDAGRGFAVVADEVRKLAEKTMQATQEVDVNIRDIQQAASSSIESMTGTLNSLSEATGLTRESGEELKNIVASVDESAQRVEDIASAANEQKATAQQVLDAVEASQSTTTYTIADMQKVSYSVQTLATRANDLRSLVEELARTEN